MTRLAERYTWDMVCGAYERSLLRAIEQRGRRKR